MHQILKSKTHRRRSCLEIFYQFPPNLGSALPFLRYCYNAWVRDETKKRDETFKAVSTDTRIDHWLVKLFADQFSRSSYGIAKVEDDIGFEESKIFCLSDFVFTAEKALW